MTAYEKALDIPSETYYLAIDSRFRNKTAYPNPWNYVVNLDDVFKNVISVELVYAVFEKVGTEQYVNLCIDELTPNVFSNSNYIKGSFTQLPIVPNIYRAFQIYDNTKFKSIKVFQKPLSKFHKMTVRFLNPDGNVYQIKDHFMRFEITCMKSQGVNEWKNFEIIGNHNISMFQAVQEWNPRYILDLPETFTEENLKKAFAKKAKVYKDVNRPKYDECKRAFKDLYSQLYTQQAT